MAHTVAKEYQIVGVTAKEFLEKHTGMDFNLVELRKIFKTHCDDYMAELQEDVKSKAVEFCSKVIYEVGPESRKVKKGTGDKVWKFIFKVGEVSHYVFIATYKQENAEFKPENTQNTMILSLKQAALLVHETLARLVVYGYRKNKILLTPLAGACFCKEDLDAFAEELGVNVPTLLIAINQSTQGGGHYLSNSDIDIAICSAYSATKNVKDENLKKSIVVKMIKQYMTQGHRPDKDRMRIISRYATGGVPSDFSYESISELITTEQRTYAALKLKRMEQETVARAVVDVPGRE
nr:hypothetical protein [Hymenopteran phasma-related virus OKIAV232]